MEEYHIDDHQSLIIGLVSSLKCNTDEMEDANRWVAGGTSRGLLNY